MRTLPVIARAEAYLHAKFHLDPSNRLAQCTNVTDSQTDRQTDRQDRTGQRSDSIGRTVLQTVAQKSFTDRRSSTFLAQR